MLCDFYFINNGNIQTNKLTEEEVEKLHVHVLIEYSSHGGGGDLMMSVVCDRACMHVVHSC